MKMLMIVLNIQEQPLWGIDKDDFLKMEERTEFHFPRLEYDWPFSDI